MATRANSGYAKNNAISKQQIMFSSPAISVANINDIPELLRLINSAYRGDAARKGWTHEADLISGNIRIDASSLSDSIQSSNAVILKYLNELKEITGCVYLQKQDDNLYLGMLSVSPDTQGSGAGKQLLKAATEYAKQLKCTSIVMTVISVRHKLIAWYERNGYYKTGETKPFPADDRFGKPTQPIEFAILKKDLN
jgi:ribosomal protein S18 acetylase RimI-like enzyme